MSTDITMQDLELETAELLPSRETLWSSSGGQYTSINQFGIGNAVQSANGGSGDGNGILNFLNGDAVNVNVL
jgi:hypothetical protein